jgi:FixJ family two-component response regulator
MNESVVYLVDDDPRVREALSELLASEKIEHLAFSSASDYLRFASFAKPDHCACLLLDIQLPEISGLELQSQLSKESSPPIIFISGHDDIPSTVRAMKAGAIEFLTKPVDPAKLLLAIRAAFAVDLERRRRLEALTDLRRRFASLTPREREVFPLVVGGMLNKQAAAILGITEVTLQAHRSQIMRKMESKSFAELVRMAAKLEIPEA